MFQANSTVNVRAAPAVLSQAALTDDTGYISTTRPIAVRIHIIFSRFPTTFNISFVLTVEVQ